MEIANNTITLGADPEFFIKKKGGFFYGKAKVVGSETVLGDVRDPNYGCDGIQAELRPEFSACRQNVAGNIRWGLYKLQENHLKKEYELCFDNTITIGKKEFDKLGADSKRFGCNPSLNAYGRKPVIPDGNLTRVRSAGGHLHFGAYECSSYIDIDHKNTAKLLDIILGNTCVLLDRDEGNKIRRKCFGLAGEYRKTDFGIEYRTLSNFWLQSYTLFSFVTGLGRLSVRVGLSKKHTKAFVDLVDFEDIEQAINTNNFALAMKNYNKIAELLGTVKGNEDFQRSNPLKTAFQPRFLELVSDGIESMLPKDLYMDWYDRPYGWESFITKTK